MYITLVNGKEFWNGLYLKIVCFLTWSGHWVDDLKPSKIVHCQLVIIENILLNLAENSLKSK